MKPMLCVWHKSQDMLLRQQIRQWVAWHSHAGLFPHKWQTHHVQRMVVRCPQAMVQNLVRSTLSLTFVISAARVVFNIKSRMTRETTWQLELKGDLTKQRRVEAVDKLLSVLTLLVGTVFGLQAIGLDGAPCNRATSTQDALGHL